MFVRTARLGFWILFLAGCSPLAAPTATFPAPVRWTSPTVSPTLVFPTPRVTQTPSSEPTTTPMTYVVKKGDTWGAIVARFGVSSTELQKANPGVDPNVLQIGQVLIIPPKTAGTEMIQPSPTPVDLKVEFPRCFYQTGGGKWCLALVGNPGSDSVSGIFVRFSLYSSATGYPSAFREVALPVMVLPAGARTVAAAFFPPEESGDEILRVEITSAVRSSEGPAILPVSIIKETHQGLPGGMEVAVDFQIDPKVASPAAHLDAVLTLLDATGQPIGFRIVHNEGSLPSGQAHHLTIDAFALSGEPAKYELILQVRP
jgi:LysM repeat protein